MLKGGTALSPTVTIQLARTRSEFEGAFRLLQSARARWNLSPQGKELWLLKHHALPSTNTIVALQAGQVVGAICLFGESAFHLPAESHLNLKSFRANLEGRLAEFSLPGLHPEFAQQEDLQLALFHFAICFGTSYCHFDGFVIDASEKWAAANASKLNLERIYEPTENHQLLFLNGREGFDFRKGMSPALTAEYEFPEKKFFPVAHQSMQPDVLNYLFNERTDLFSKLYDQDLRVLKNIYDYGEFSKILPARDLKMPEKKTPRYPRFPMNCEGFIMNNRGGREHVQVVDVSREGLKLRVAQPMNAGMSYALTLFVGVNKKTEVIASVIWADDTAEMVGLEIKSSDENWQQLIAYLEKDFLRVA